METLWNVFPISMYQEGPSHESYFITVDMERRVIIGSNKKIVATYIIGELALLDWFIGSWKLKKRYYYDWYLIYLVRSKVKSDDKTISYAIVISVSASCSKHCFIALFSWWYELWTHILWMIALCTIGIYSVDTFLYSYTLLIDSTLYTFSSLCLSYNLS